MRPKNKMWTKPQIKSYKKNPELRLIRPQMQYKNPEHTYLKDLIQLTPTVEKIMNLCHGFKCIIQ